MTGGSHFAGYPRLAVMTVYSASALGAFHPPRTRSSERSRSTYRSLRAMEACVGLSDLGSDVESVYAMLAIDAVVAVAAR